MHKQCKVAGCKKRGQFKGYCMFHFREVYGITYAEYTSNRREIGEDPQVVALRIENKDEADRIKRGQDAKEAFDQAMREEKEKRVKPETKAPEPETTATNHVEKQEAEKRPGDEKGAGKPEFVTGPQAGCRPVMLPNELYEKIVQLAKEEFRPVDMQAQYLIHKGLQASTLPAI